MTRKLNGPIEPHDWSPTGRQVWRRDWLFHDGAWKNSLVRFRLYFDMQTRRFSATCNRRPKRNGNWTYGTATDAEVAMLRAMLPPREIAIATALALAYRDDPNDIPF